MGKINTSQVAGKTFVTLSPHDTKFWTGEMVEGDEVLAKSVTLKDVSQSLADDGVWEIVEFKKELTAEGEKILKALIESENVDFILTPAMFASVNLSSLPKTGKMVAFNATAETQRSAPQDKIASNKLTFIW